MGAKIHELLMNTYRSSIVAFLVYFQSSYAGLLGPLSCVSNFSNFTQETFQFLKPTFTDIAVTVKRDAPTLGLEEQEKFCRNYRQLVSDYDKNDNEKWMQSVFKPEAGVFLDHGVSIVKGIVEALGAFGKFSNPHLVYEPEASLEALCTPTAIPLNGSNAITFTSCVAELMVKVDSLQRVINRWPTRYFNFGPEILIRCTPFRSFGPQELPGDSLVEWPRLLVNNPFVDMAKTYMQTTASLLLENFLEKSELAACCPGGNTSVGEDALADLKCLVDIRKMPTTLSAAKTWFSKDPTASAESYLPPSRMVNVWRWFFPNAEMRSAVELQDVTLFHSSSDSDMNSIEPVMQHFADLNILIASLGFIVSVLMSHDKKQLLFDKKRLTGGIKRAVEVSVLQVDKIKADMVSEHRELFQRACKSRMTFAQLDVWLEKLKSMLPDLKAMLCQCALKELKPLVDDVRRYTPDWQGIVNDHFYVKAKAQQGLIAYPFTSLLETSTKDLFDAVVDLANTATTWSVANILDEDDCWTTLKACSISTISDAKQFLRVRAGCNIVQNCRGKNQQEQAEWILKRSKNKLPAKLESALRYCLRKQNGSGFGFHDDVSPEKRPRHALADDHDDVSPGTRPGHVLADEAIME